jgi:hypothetical protein
MKLIIGFLLYTEKIHYYLKMTKIEENKLLKIESNDIFEP